ncbi:AAEL000681-PA [Aedes aegypti]|uniref:AAEL000681-PA n=1 Tax=Aedes aegypti TaxID=7159 RepID=Q17NF3_AEDAE|nr:AAEL000681-PA [Aedes aegypti]
MGKSWRTKKKENREKRRKFKWYSDQQSALHTWFEGSPQILARSFPPRRCPRRNNRSGSYKKFEGSDSSPGSCAEYGQKHWSVISPTEYQAGPANSPATSSGRWNPPETPPSHLIGPPESPATTSRRRNLPRTPPSHLVGQAKSPATSESRQNLSRTPPNHVVEPAESPTTLASRRKPPRTPPSHVVEPAEGPATSSSRQNPPRTSLSHRS